MAVSSRLVKVTPAMAERWLEGNVLNRSIKDRIVKFYADQMKRNMWKTNGSTLVFASDGTMLDGQHRLWGCIEAKTPFVTFVCEGVDKDTFPTIDTGANRTVADVLNISGYKKYSSTLGQAATHILNYNKSDLNTFKKKICRADVLQFVDDNPELQEYVTIARHTKSAVRKHAAVVIAVCYMAGRKHPQGARNFLKKFMSGEELTAKSPILVLRNRLMAESNLRPIERLTLVANAWNAYVANKQIGHLKITGSALPKITGA